MCAGFVRGEGNDRYADILAWMQSKSLGFIKAWCSRKGYQFETISRKGSHENQRNHISK